MACFKYHLNLYQGMEVHRDDLAAFEMLQHDSPYQAELFDKCEELLR